MYYLDFFLSVLLSVWNSSSLEISSNSSFPVPIFLEDVSFSNESSSLNNVLRPTCPLGPVRYSFEIIFVF